MKTKTNKMLALALAVLFNCITGSAFAAALGFSPVAGALGMNCIASMVGGEVAHGTLRAGVYKEIWTGELVKYLRRGLEATWLEGIPDASSIVDNDVIHLVEVGVDPEVLVNNTTYPIPLQALSDKDIAIQLDKFQTKVTPITDDELYAISYDKMSRVKESHGNAINDAKFAKAAHALCAKQNTEKTPVLKTTGEKDPVTGRLKMTKTDLLSAKRQMDALKVPSQGRRLVLCSDHINDLLEIEQTFREQYNINRTTELSDACTGSTSTSLPTIPSIPRLARRRTLARRQWQESSRLRSLSIRPACSRPPARRRCTGRLQRTTRSISATKSTSATASSVCQRRRMPVSW